MGEFTCGWYEQYAPGYPSTNNALEATNNLIKNESTFRELLPMNEFLSCVEEFVTNWSKDRDPSFVTTKKYVEIPTIDTHQWTLAFNWVKFVVRSVSINNSNWQLSIDIELIDSSSSNTTVNQSNQVSTLHEEESNIPPGTSRIVIIPLSNVNTNRKQPRGRPPKNRNEVNEQTVENPSKRRKISKNK
ncbi:hypothetical protein BpHYR1_020504 [Brachionus plicatilis]|uniref:Uncharacterized protein n=1 Tax=Brachionus plicatilis TaxID=10195 RepID=A0A3M7QCB9_BRAPC|nr:hypothetical protein BpHYR1_020504 [Brachionus plicatilis]